MLPLKSRRSSPLNIRVDKLTNSIENATTHESFRTLLRRLTVKEANTLRKEDWDFDWVREARDKSREVYVLCTVDNPTIIHGIISIEDQGTHMYMHLVESAPFNKGKTKTYLGVLGNMAAFVCQRAFEKNYDGFVAFESKTKLIEHYKKTLEAEQMGSGIRMSIGTRAAIKLVKQYFPTYFSM
ncbi:MAG: hypothetical protein ACRYG7_46925 [Janthinobacterium lividum]